MLVVGRSFQLRRRLFSAETTCQHRDRLRDDVEPGVSREKSRYGTGPGPQNVTFQASERLSPRHRIIDSPGRPDSVVWQGGRRGGRQMKHTHTYTHIVPSSTDSSISCAVVAMNGRCVNHRSSRRKQSSSRTFVYATSRGNFLRTDGGRHVTVEESTYMTRSLSVSGDSST